jgi:hypothetical protein
MSERHAENMMLGSYREEKCILCSKDDRGSASKDRLIPKRRQAFLLNHRKARLLVCYTTSEIINSDHQLDLHNTEQSGERGNKKLKED